MNYGTTGVGSDDHLLMLGLEGLAGLQPMTHAPFAGSAPLLAQVLGGHIELGVGNMAEILAAMREGRVRALGQAAERRWEAAPDVPTFREQGFDMVAAPPAASPGRRGCRRRSAPSWNRPSRRRWPIPPSCGRRSASSCRSGRWWARPTATWRRRWTRRSVRSGRCGPGAADTRPGGGGGAKACHAVVDFRRGGMMPLGREGLDQRLGRSAMDHRRRRRRCWST
jgi:hypothetical protein